MRITIAINTWNRAALLDRTLGRFRELRIPDGIEWDVLVVDNNSHDDTQAVLKRHSRNLPLRSDFEPRQGTSFAKNRVVRLLESDYVLWTDDDVLVEPNWVSEYVRAIRRYPRAAFFGGPIDPWFETPPPRWLEREWDSLGRFLAVLDFGPDVRPLTTEEYPFGANMAFRVSDLKAFGFDEKIGDVGRALRKGEDVVLVQRMGLAGRTGVWVGTARVRHFVPRSRMTAGYFWRIVSGIHRAESENQEVVAAGVRRIGPVPRYFFRQYFAALARLAVQLLRRDDTWIRELVRAARYQGMIQGSYSRGRKAVPAAYQS